MITESMIQRMEEYMRAKSELEDTIDDFEKASRQLSNETVDEENQDAPQLDIEPEVEAKVEEGPFIQAEPEVISEVPLEVEESAVEKEVPEQDVDEADQLEGGPKDGAVVKETSEILVKETEDETEVPEPAIIEEESASSGTASPPAAVAEEIGPENSSFAEKVQKLEHMIKTHPQKIPRPSDESESNDIEVDNLVLKDIPADLPIVDMDKMKGVQATDIDDVPPPLKTENEPGTDPEPSKLEDVLAESMEHIPAPIDEADEIPSAAEVTELPLEDTEKVSSAPNETLSKAVLPEPATDEEVPTKVIPKEAAKLVVEEQEQPPLQQVEVSSSPQTEEVVFKETFKEVSPPAQAVEVEPEDDLDIEDLEVIEEAEAEEEAAITEHPLSESEEVVMKPDKTPLPNNSTLNMAPRRYSFEAEKPDEVDRPARKSKRSLNSSGHTSDSDRSTASEKGQQWAQRIFSSVFTSKDYDI